jgi:hypothetical protein
VWITRRQPTSVIAIGPSLVTLSLALQSTAAGDVDRALRLVGPPPRVEQRARPCGHGWQRLLAVRPEPDVEERRRVRRRAGAAAQRGARGRARQQVAAGGLVPNPDAHRERTVPLPGFSYVTAKRLAMS